MKLLPLLFIALIADQASATITCSLRYFTDASCSTPYIFPDQNRLMSFSVKGLGKDQCTDDDRPPKHEYFAYVSECAADTVTWAWGDATCAAVDNCQSDKRQAWSETIGPVTMEMTEPKQAWYAQDCTSYTMSRGNVCSPSSEVPRNAAGSHTFYGPPYNGPLDSFVATAPVENSAENTVPIAARRREHRSLLSHMPLSSLFAPA